MAETVDKKTGIISYVIDIPVGKKQKVHVPVFRPNPLNAVSGSVVVNSIG